jgi:uncharacterized protein YoxC
MSFTDRRLDVAKIRRVIQFNDENRKFSKKASSSLDSNTSFLKKIMNDNGNTTMQLYQKAEEINTLRTTIRELQEQLTGLLSIV